MNPLYILNYNNNLSREHKIVIRLLYVTSKWNYGRFVFRVRVILTQAVSPYVFQGPIPIPTADHINVVAVNGGAVLGSRGRNTVLVCKRYRSPHYVAEKIMEKSINNTKQSGKTLKKKKLLFPRRLFWLGISERRR